MDLENLQELAFGELENSVPSRSSFLDTTSSVLSQYSDLNPEYSSVLTESTVEVSKSMLNEGKRQSSIPFPVENEPIRNTPSIPKLPIQTLNESLDRSIGTNNATSANFSKYRSNSNFASITPTKSFVNTSSSFRTPLSNSNRDVGYRNSAAISTPIYSSAISSPNVSQIQPHVDSSFVTSEAIPVSRVVEAAVRTDRKRMDERYRQIIHLCFSDLSPYFRKLLEHGVRTLTSYNNRRDYPSNGGPIRPDVYSPATEAGIGPETKEELTSILETIESIAKESIELFQTELLNYQTLSSRTERTVRVSDRDTARISTLESELAAANARIVQVETTLLEEQNARKDELHEWELRLARSKEECERSAAALAKLREQSIILEEQLLNEQKRAIEFSDRIGVLERAAASVSAVTPASLNLSFSDARYSASSSGGPDDANVSSRMHSSSQLTTERSEHLARLRELRLQHSQAVAALEAQARAREDLLTQQVDALTREVQQLQSSSTPSTISPSIERSHSERTREDEREQREESVWERSLFLQQRVDELSREVIQLQDLLQHERAAAETRRLQSIEHVALRLDSEREQLFDELRSQVEASQIPHLQRLVTSYEASLREWSKERESLEQLLRAREVERDAARAELQLQLDIVELLTARAEASETLLNSAASASFKALESEQAVQALLLRGSELAQENQSLWSALEQSNAKDLQGQLQGAEQIERSRLDTMRVEVYAAEQLEAAQELQKEFGSLTTRINDLSVEAKRLREQRNELRETLILVSMQLGRPPQIVTSPSSPPSSVQTNVSNQETSSEKTYSLPPGVAPFFFPASPRPQSSTPRTPDITSAAPSAEVNSHDSSGEMESLHIPLSGIPDISGEVHALARPYDRVEVVAAAEAAYRAYSSALSKAEELQKEMDELRAHMEAVYALEREIKLKEQNYMNSIEQLQGQLHDAEVSRDQLTLEHENLKESFSRVVGEKEALTIEVRELEDVLKVERENFEQMKNTLFLEKNDLERLKDELIDEKTHLESNYDELMTKFNSLQAENANTLAELKYHHEIKINLERANAVLEEERQSLKEKTALNAQAFDEKLTELQVQQAEIENLLRQKDQLTANYTNLLEERNEILSQLESLQKEKESLDALSGSHSDSEQSLKRRIEELETAAISATQSLHSMESRLKEAEDRAEAAENAAEAASRVAQAESERAEALFTELQSKTFELSNMTDQLPEDSSISTELAAAKEKIQSLLDEIARKDELLKEKASELIVKQKIIEEHATTLSSLQKDYQGVLDRERALSAQISAQEAPLGLQGSATTREAVPESLSGPNTERIDAMYVQSLELEQQLMHRQLEEQQKLLQSRESMHELELQAVIVELKDLKQRYGELLEKSVFYSNQVGSLVEKRSPKHKRGLIETETKLDEGSNVDVAVESLPQNEVGSTSLFNTQPLSSRGPPSPQTPQVVSRGVVEVDQSARPAESTTERTAVEVEVDTSLSSRTSVTQSPLRQAAVNHLHSPSSRSQSSDSEARSLAGDQMQLPRDPSSITALSASANSPLAFSEGSTPNFFVSPRTAGTPSPDPGAIQAVAPPPQLNKLSNSPIPAVGATSPKTNTSARSSQVLTAPESAPPVVFIQSTAAAPLVGPAAARMDKPLKGRVTVHSDSESLLGSQSLLDSAPDLQFGEFRSESDEKMSLSLAVERPVEIRELPRNKITPSESVTDSGADLQSSASAVGITGVSMKRVLRESHSLLENLPNKPQQQIPQVQTSQRIIDIDNKIDVVDPQASSVPPSFTVSGPHSPQQIKNEGVSATSDTRENVNVPIVVGVLSPRLQRLLGHNRELVDTSIASSAHPLSDDYERNHIHFGSDSLRSSTAILSESMRRIQAIRESIQEEDCEDEGQDADSIDLETRATPPRRSLQSHIALHSGGYQRSDEFMLVPSQSLHRDHNPSEHLRRQPLSSESRVGIHYHDVYRISGDGRGQDLMGHLHTSKVIEPTRSGSALPIRSSPSLSHGFQGVVAPSPIHSYMRCDPTSTVTRSIDIHSANYAPSSQTKSARMSRPDPFIQRATEASNAARIAAEKIIEKDGMKPRSFMPRAYAPHALNMSGSHESTSSSNLPTAIVGFEVISEPAMPPQESVRKSSPPRIRPGISNRLKHPYQRDDMSSGTTPLSGYVLIAPILDNDSELLPR